MAFHILNEPGINGQSSLNTSHLKKAIFSMDDQLLFQLLYVSQFALNDLPTIERVSQETGYSENRVEELAGIALNLTTLLDGETLDISTLAELDKMLNPKL